MTRARGLRRGADDARRNHNTRTQPVGEKTEFHSLLTPDRRTVRCRISTVRGVVSPDRELLFFNRRGHVKVVGPPVVSAAVINRRRTRAEIRFESKSVARAPSQSIVGVRGALAIVTTPVPPPPPPLLLLAVV